MSTNNITGDKLRTKVATEAYRDNFDAIFKEKCPYCGIRVEDPCDEAPSDICERAINEVYMKALND